MYRAFGLLKPDSNFSLAAAAEKLAAKLPALTLTRENERITLAAGNWEIHLTLNTSPEVIGEARQFEEGIGGDEDDLGIVTCDRRVEVESDYQDPDMAHFGDYQAVIEVLQSFRGVIAIDPQEPSLL